MPTITIIRDDTGKIDGFSERDKKSYARFVKKMRGLEVGEMMRLSHKFDRSGPFHRLHMKMLNVAFDSQEQFTDFNMFRYWVAVGAGHCTMVPGPDGKPVAIAKSIDYDSMDDEEMREHHENVKRFMREPHYAFFLWPHLDANKRADMVAAILEGFEQ